jgi:hypothetical protein
VDPRVPQTAPSEQDRELAAALSGLAAYRGQVDALRASQAADVAAVLVADLVTCLANHPDMIVADALCQRLGRALDEEREELPGGRVDPQDLAQALITAAVAAVESTVGQEDAWRAPWRVLTAVADVLPYPDGETAAEAIARLRDTVAGRVLPAMPPGPAVTGPLLWTRDRYGSRFAVTAPITTADAGERWYLWDIDACGHQACTVHSGFYTSPEAALAEWQAGVGPIAAAGTELAVVDDSSLVAELLPIEEGLMRTGGENMEQLAEYHRGKRLAQAAKQAMAQQRRQPDGGLKATAAAAEFTEWLRAGNSDRPELPDDLDELADELADSWNLNNIDAVFATCSPHRVALCVPHLRNYYLDDFADQLVALLPDWIRWLAARNATPPELAERCLPYVHGEPHPQIAADDSGSNYYARVLE